MGSPPCVPHQVERLPLGLLYQWVSDRDPDCCDQNRPSPPLFFSTSWSATTAAVAPIATGTHPEIASASTSQIALCINAPIFALSGTFSGFSPRVNLL